MSEKKHNKFRWYLLENKSSQQSDLFLMMKFPFNFLDLSLTLFPEFFLIYYPQNWCDQG